MTKKFEVIQVIPSTTYVTYHVEATSKEEAEELARSYADSVIEISRDVYENDNTKYDEYDVYEINEN